MEHNVNTTLQKKPQAVFHIHYRVDDVVDMIIQVGFSIKSVVSLPVVLESFQEQVFECH